MRLLAIGLAAGFYGALFGVGGGTVIVPLLVLGGYMAREAAATSLAAIGVTAAAAVVVYSFYGEVQPAYAALVGVPAAAGVVLGAALQQRLKNRALLGAFAIFLAVIGVTLVIG
jgi:uncharacterized membrane protein YfcA